jgi:hypothetical protein
MKKISLLISIIILFVLSNFVSATMTENNIEVTFNIEDSYTVDDQIMFDVFFTSTLSTSIEKFQIEIENNNEAVFKFTDEGFFNDSKISGYVEELNTHKPFCDSEGNSCKWTITLYTDDDLVAGQEVYVGTVTGEALSAGIFKLSVILDDNSGDETGTFFKQEGSGPDVFFHPFSLTEVDVIVDDGPIPGITFSLADDSPEAGDVEQGANGFLFASIEITTDVDTTLSGLELLKEGTAISTDYSNAVVKKNNGVINLENHVLVLTKDNPTTLEIYADISADATLKNTIEFGLSATDTDSGETIGPIYGNAMKIVAVPIDYSDVTTAVDNIKPILEQYQIDGDWIPALIKVSNVLRGFFGLGGAE